MQLLTIITSLATLSLTSIASADSDRHKKKTSSNTCEITLQEGKATAELHPANFIVTGMTCGGCSAKVAKTLNAVDGITVKKVCHKSGTVAVIFDTSKTNNAEIQQIINKTGFKVVAQKLFLPVKGMSCSACSAKLTKALNALEGCTVTKVCAKSGHAEVIIKTSKLTKEKVIQAISNTGFKVLPTVK